MPNKKKPSPKAKETKKTKIVIDDKVETVNVIPIEYSKYNPKLPFEMSKIWWNILKFGLAISLAVFAVLGLYFSTVWQSQANGDKPAIGTLMQMKMIALNGKNLEWTFTNIFDPPRAEIVALNLLAPGLSSASLFDLVPWFTNEILVSIMTFSIIGILTIIPLLIFKNGTVCSLVTLTMGSIFVIIVIAMFSVGISAQNTLLDPFNDIKNTCLQIDSLTKANNPAYSQELINLNNHLNNAINNFTNLFKA